MPRRVMKQSVDPTMYPPMPSQYPGKPSHPAICHAYPPDHELGHQVGECDCRPSTTMRWETALVDQFIANAIT
ncbi:hypothetical protein Aduo_000922 [Ancylostoma duodenale]